MISGVGAPKVPWAVPIPVTVSGAHAFGGGPAKLFARMGHMYACASMHTRMLYPNSNICPGTVGASTFTNIIAPHILEIAVYFSASYIPQICLKRMSVMVQAFVVHLGSLSPAWQGELPPPPLRRVRRDAFWQRRLLAPQHLRHLENSL